MLKDKKILIAVTGSIAAYKIASLVRLLMKAKAKVQVIMTESASEFITPLTLATLSKNPVYTSFYKTENGEWNNHVELGLWADIMLVAPASANTIAKMSSGICDSLLMATYLSAKCPVAFAPAMDLDMYQHPSTKENIAKLIAFGHEMIAPGTGELASGLMGEGRMAEPEEIVSYLENKLNPINFYTNKNILVTAGPTYEAIDPVRFIGNASSGKMGYALAEAFAEKGANVTLISGPTNLKAVHSNIQTISVTAAAEMFSAVQSQFEKTQIFVMAAAVADYTPTIKSKEKIKKSSDEMNVELTKTIDILKYIGEHKSIDQISVGFALETENELSNAQSKLKSKNADLIILNSLKDEGAGFNGDQNKVTMLDNQGLVEEYELKPKNKVAEDILQKITQL
jgi:phosphopantothenoylcysteine decarboxylase / phosphopantothenate---cysteine ligase